MSALATVADLEARWRPLSLAETGQASVLLEDASAIVRSEAVTIDARVTAGVLDANIPVLVVCGMVKRAMLAGATGEGVQTAQTGTGPFTQSLTFANPMGNLYLTRQDRRMLGLRQRAFSIDLAPDAGSEFAAAPSWDGLE